MANVYLKNALLDNENVKAIRFDTTATPTTPAEGVLQYNSDDSAISIGDQKFISGSARIGDAANNTTFEADGSMVLNGDATVWDDLRGPASGINPAGSSSAATPNTTDGSLTFSKGNVAIAWFQMSHSWKLASEIHVHIHWSKATTNNGTVNWQMKYKWFNIGDVDPGFSVLATGSEEVPNSNTVGKHAIYEWPAVSGVGKTLSSMICVYIERVNSGDTYTGTCNLYEIDIHYQIDSLGSRQELIK